MWNQPLENKAVSILEGRWHNSPSVDGRKTCANEKHDPWRSSSEHRKERQNWLGNKETLRFVQCSIFMKGIERTDKYLSCYSDLRKTVKWPNVSVKLCTFNRFLCTKHETQARYNIQVLSARGSKFPDIWKSKIQMSQVLMNDSCQRSNQHKGA